MLSSIWKYEVAMWFKKPTFYIYLLVFSTLAFVGFIGSSGFFDPQPENASLDYINSPYGINYMLQLFNKLFLFLLPAIVGLTIYKDYNSNSHSILYSYPIRKSDYLFGKFLSGLIIVLIIVSSTVLAFMIGEFIPGLHEHKIGQFNAFGYLWTMSVITIPNLLIFGAIIFSIITLTRNIYACFVVIIVLFFIQNISQNLFHGNGFLISLLDPFGENAINYITRNWTLENRNKLFIPLQSELIFNRILWFSIGFITFYIAFKRFKFSQFIRSLIPIKITNNNRTKKESNNTAAKINLSNIKYQYLLKNQLYQIRIISNFYLKRITKSWMFYVLIGFGLLAVLFSIGKVTNNEEMRLLPVTHIVLTIPAFFFTTIIMLLTFIYSGLLIHKAKSSKINQLIDTTPTNNWVLILSKLIAIIKMQTLLLFVMMLAGIAVQVYNGYYNFEINQYLFDLFILKFSGLIIWALASITIHTLLKNTYLGIFALILLWLGISALPTLGINSRLLLFNFGEPLRYSDFTGYGSELFPYLVTKLYWFIFGLVLLIIAYSFWNRGFSFSLKERFNMAKISFTKSLKFVSLVTIVFFILFGFTIHKGERAQELNETSQEKLFENFLEKFKKYNNIDVQPKITAVGLNISIFPYKYRLEIDGYYWMKNKSKKAIDTVLIKTGFDETTTFNLSTNFNIVDKDDYVHFYVLRLNESLQPNDSIQLNFNIRSKEHTLFENDSKVLKNGTFFKNNILPRIGYFLNSHNKSPSDSTASNKHYYSQDSDAIQLRTTISTSEDQIAIAPGDLIRKWKKSKRNYFEYKTSSKIKNSLSFSSGIYETYTENYEDVAIKLLYHKNHTHNLKSMIQGTKAALNYNAKYFGKYQFNEARIIEFPITEGTYASVMANSIPTSEMRFIADSGSESINISFYTIAHELTHQWFGNQIIPADAFGATMLSESITEYISLNILEEAYGTDKKMQFLKMQHERYLRGHSKEINDEPPLYLVKGDQQYLAYGKGAIAFNTLSHYIGKEKLHELLNAFLNNYKFKEAPYPTSLDLLNHLKNYITDSYQYLLKDYFETITFHEAKIKNASIDKNYVVVDFEYSKFRNNNNSKSIPVNDYIEIGLYDENEQLITLKRIKVTQLKNRFTYEFTTKPSKVIIDPNWLLIEKNRKDNNINL